MKELVKSIQKLGFRLCSSNSKAMNYMMKVCCEAYECYSDNYVTYRKRSKTSKNTYAYFEKSENISDCAIIIQGPVVLENTFTLETCKYYKKLMPSACIILSTWNDTPEEVLQEFVNLGVVIVLNVPPTVSGVGNMNYQIISTRGGIDKAIEMGKKYVLKTRSDQRIYRPGFLNYFKSLLQLFPVLPDGNIPNQVNRIITLQGSVGASMLIPFFLADFMYFGTAYDIKNIFELPLDNSVQLNKEERKVFLDSLKGKTTMTEYYNQTAPEIKIMYDYVNYSKTDKKVKFNVEEYWRFVKNHVITLGWDDVNLFWPKYGRFEESKLFRIFDEEDNNNRMLQFNWTFVNWINLYTGQLRYDEELEKYGQQSSAMIKY